MKEFLVKIDKVIIGLGVGSVLPIIGFYISYLVKARNGVVSFDGYMNLAFNQSMEQQDILIFCLIPNMFMFYLSNFRWQINEFTKGLVGITIVLLVALILLTY